MATVRTRGFTLIELLTVIAIIAILAAITAVAVPKVRMRAKLRATEAGMNQIGTIMATYYADNNSYPPGYGYGLFGTSLSSATDFVVQPWNAIIGLYNSDDVMDPWAETHDTNLNNRIDLLEFLPVGQLVGPKQLAYPNDVYVPGGSLSAAVQNDLNKQLKQQRPFVYLPVNLDDFRKVAAYYNDPNAADFVDRQNARTWDSTNRGLQSVMSHVPARYDSFVLISVGPNQNTAGVLPDPMPISQIGPNVYYMTALRAYFLATRDANNNGSDDFDWRSRTYGPDNSAQAYSDFGAAASKLVLMPNGSGAPGPLIWSKQ